MARSAQDVPLVYVKVETTLIPVSSERQLLTGQKPKTLRRLHLGLLLGPVHVEVALDCGLYVLTKGVTHETGTHRESFCSPSPRRLPALHASPSSFHKSAQTEFMVASLVVDVSSMNMERTPVSISRQTRRSEIFHVLVVDDHPLLRQGLHSLISAFREFTIVGEAEDGEQACDLAQRLQPDIILMDVHMPKMNGIEATRQIKATLPHVIIIGLSVNPSRTVADDMKAAGASAYLTKETSPDDLYRAIHAALAK